MISAVTLTENIVQYLFENGFCKNNHPENYSHFTITIDFGVATEAKR